MEKNYVSGIIGALLGGIIASLPWVLMYVYGNMILSLLAILIAMGALKGYEIFKGKKDKKLPIIIAIISFAVVTVANFIFIPLLLLNNEGFQISISNLQLLYQSSEFTTALVKDFIISIIFTFIGIGGVIGNIKKQVNLVKPDDASEIINE